MGIKPKGGKREGAGRPRGSKNLRTRRLEETAARLGVTPLEIMLEAMNEMYQAKGAIAAFDLARDCAPYLHPRLASTAVTGPNGGDLLAKLRDLNLRISFVGPVVNKD